MASTLRKNPRRRSIVVTAAAAGAVDRTDTMDNLTQDNSTAVIDNLSEEPNNVVTYFWITGLALSSVCLILQLLLYLIRPPLRKLDQKILTQLTIARLSNSMLEFMVTYSYFNLYTRDVTFVLYIQTDTVLVCWMFVYTKHLYDKVVLVFALQKWNFMILSLLIWTLTLLIGVIGPIALQLYYFMEFYYVYLWLKFAILVVNLLFFCEIFYVIINNRKKSNRNFTKIIKIGVISFILVCLTSLQVIATDAPAFISIIFDLDPIVVINPFSIINSYQGIAATIIFLILARNEMKICSK